MSDKPIKVVLVSESGVGKTSILTRLIQETFDPCSVSNIGITQTVQTINIVKKNTSLTFDIWDTAGQERFRSLTKVFFKNAKIVVFVYDITNETTFNALKTFWFENARDNCGSNVIFAIAANKSDLYENEEVNEEDVKNFAKSIDAIYVQTSACNNAGIDTLFQFIGMKYLDSSFNYLESDKQQEQYLQEYKDGRKRIKLNDKANQKEEEKGCGC